MDEIEAISQYFRFFHFGPYTNVVHLDQNGIGDQERLEDATHYYIALLLKKSEIFSNFFRILGFLTKYGKIQTIHTFLSVRVKVNMNENSEFLSQVIKLSGS